MTDNTPQGRPTPDPRQPHDQSQKRRRDSDKQRTLDRIVAEQEARGTRADVREEDSR
jgi:hypothetical protein